MTTNSPTIELARALIRLPSITPDDRGCQKLLTNRLMPLNFNCEALRFGEVDNLWARRGQTKPLFVFAGHTDVVPIGKKSDWLIPAFEGEIRNGMLHGRGAADMKGSLAAMITATENFIDEHPGHRGSIAFLITSDEEGDAIDGTTRVVETLTARDEKIDWCLVGEPTSQAQVGDMIKLGRRGSLSGKLTVLGKQGHVAYPHLADNPIYRCAALIKTLAEAQWDEGNQHFPPTTFQISNIHAGTGAGNVIPGEAEIDFNFRFSPESTVDQLKSRVEQICADHEVKYKLNWTLSGRPFQTQPAELTDAVLKAIRETTDLNSELSTTGGTSDGRFIAPTGAQVVELGPVNATIHKVNEQVTTDDLDTLSKIYQRVLEKLLA